MYKNSIFPLILFFCLIAIQYSQAQTSGTVFRDFNGNGTRQTGSVTAAYHEPGVAGVTVTAYNSSDVAVGTTVSSSTGAWSLPTVTSFPVRLEFTMGNTGCNANSNFDFSSANVHGNSVRFVAASSTTINYGINNPTQYVFDPTATGGAPTYTFANTFIYSAVQRAGDPLGGGNSGTAFSFFKFPYNRSGTTPPNTAAERLATNAQIGTVYGVSYSQQASRVFTSAYMKRHSGFGPANGTFNNAPGAIYMIDPSLNSTTGAASYFISLDALGFPTHNSTGAPAYGAGTSYNITGTEPFQTITYLPGGEGVVGVNGAGGRNLPAATTTSHNDPAAFGQVGKVSLGDLEISDDGRYLFVVNLYDRKIYQLQLNSITAPTSATVVGSWNLPNPPLRNTVTGFAAVAGYNSSNFYDGTAGVQRPFALKYYRGKLYVGSVTTGENGGTTTTDNNTGTPEYTDLWAYVWEFDPSTGNFASTPVLQTPLNFNRGTNNSYPDNPPTEPAVNETWNVWNNTISTRYIPQYSSNDIIVDPQPIFSDIEFDVDGSMIIGFRDRTGDQTGTDEYALSGTTRRLSGEAMGDMYRVYKDPTNCIYLIEANGTAGGLSGTSNGQGPSNYSGANGEFYDEDDWQTPPLDYHMNTSIGAFALLPGNQRVVSTFMDANQFWNNGIRWMNNNNGNNDRQYALIAGNGTGVLTATGTVGKAIGLGDIELLTQAPPIELGNRIWNDANNNGIQDAGEAAIANVSLEIFADFDNNGIPDGAALGTTTTDANGEWYFNTANITDGDPNVAGNQAGPQPNRTYLIRVAAADWTGGSGVNDLAGLTLTTANVTGNGAADLSDNDGAIAGSGAGAVPQISITTGGSGQNNHSLDFGFRPAPAIASLGDKVWRDDNKDGIQDAGEPGVAGVTVTLYDNSGNVVGTTVTDAYGNYLFDNLQPGNYQVGFTPPANYTFTTQTNNNDNTTLTGGSTAANGSDVNSTTGRTANILLTAGENERNIDAGIIFSQPTTNSIGDRVWFDADGDGTQDANEAGVSGVTVTLYASDGVTVIATTVTDANGNYLFSGLPANTNYIVGLTPPAGMLLTTTSGTTPGNTTVNSDFSTTTFKTAVVNTGAAGTQITGIDAGLIQQPAAAASLGDRVWNDLNNNGIQDAGEPGVAGVQAELLDGSGNSIDPDGAGPLTQTLTTTDAFGNYIFNNLPAGSYQVQFGTVAGFNRSTIQNAGTNDFADNDANTSGRTATYTLTAGQRNLSVDAALVSTSGNTASVGDYVWFDTDKDGVQDSGEPGIGGVTVTLYNSGGTAIATTTTDANGKYLFPNLAAGTYSVGFSNLPSGYSFTTSTGTTSISTSTNSDANQGTGRTGTFALAAGENLTGLDAGLVAGTASGLGSIGNKVWWDVVTNNNIQDAGEPGVPGVTVLLDYDINGDGDFGDAGEAGFATTTTNALGEYVFTGLAAGTYQVRFTNLPTGSSTVTQNSGSDDTVDSDGSAVVNATGASVSTTGIYTLATGEENLTVDLGLINTARAAIGNRVWFDNGAGGGTANDGIQNGGEIGVAGVMVTLVNAAGQFVDINGNVTTNPVVTTTDANGYYAFANLAPGTAFAVRFSNLPAGFTFTTQAGTGGGDDNRSDANTGTGLTGTVTTVANTFNPNLDGGIVSSRAALGNYVWLDDDGDGVQDAGEPGVAGVTVTLYRPGFGPDGIAGNGDDALPVASMITDQNGGYLFSNLEAGTYEVEFSTIPGGLVFTQQNTPGDNGNNTNSDANPTTGRTTGITLTAGEVDLTVDAGLFKPRAVIGNYVWSDLNGDGVQQSTEPSVPGILVRLLDGGGNVVAVAVTDANGGYLFPNVAPGTYSLSFSNLPQGAAFTTSNAGGDDNVDSDVVGTTITGITVTTTTVNLSFDAGIVNIVTLPATGLRLTATLQNNQVTLNWKTLSENNTAYFEIERSGDNQRFTNLGRVTAAGNSSTDRNYDLMDNITGVAQQGVLYYRVKLYDADGKATFSNTAVVRLRNTGIKVWPNPFTETVQLSVYASVPAQAEIRVMDASGKIVIASRNGLAAGVNQLSVKGLQQLPAGNYMLQVIEPLNGINAIYQLQKQ